MTSIDEIKQYLKDKNLTYIAKQSRVPYIFVWRIANGKSKNPLYVNVKKLGDYIDEQHR